MIYLGTDGVQSVGRILDEISTRDKSLDISQPVYSKFELRWLHVLKITARNTLNLKQNGQSRPTLFGTCTSSLTPCTPPLGSIHDHLTRRLILFNLVQCFILIKSQSQLVWEACHLSISMNSLIGRHSSDLPYTTCSRSSSGTQ